MKTLVLIPCLILTNLVFSQNILVEYDVNVNGQQSKDKLMINDSISVYNNNSDNAPLLEEKSFLLKKYFENSIYLREGIFNQLFYVRDTLNNMKWELTNETKLVLNEKCYSAKTQFRGRSYLAYYSTSLAYYDGPWKFGGLPGLILEVKSEDNAVQFSATKIIKNFVEKVEPVRIDNYKFMEWNEYANKFIATIDKYVKLVRSNGSIDNSSKAKIKIDAPEIIYPKAQQGEGISF